ncbi:hypothetical protein QBC42DRAFT_349914 [Cladorrhinum samala]|uniref:C2H2-type domain-containing protein n=1 Tax=Cladorrhinum samala TaxID=585594 RepID=A0AAV9HDV6_9PEZI|nr:hypothetical protein QBC42DRAFT_349914 [Cladorrhinum samala]
MHTDSAVPSLPSASGYLSGATGTPDQRPTPDDDQLSTHACEPSPAKVTSDIFPVQVASSEPLDTAGKYVNGEERRKATAVASKQRSSTNAGIHKLSSANVSRTPSKSPGPALAPPGNRDRMSSLLSDLMARYLQENQDVVLEIELGATGSAGAPDVEMMDQAAVEDGERAGSSSTSQPDNDLASKQLEEESGEPPSSEMARPYTEIHGNDTCGALIPLGYELYNATPHHPWICPIRSCRNLFPNIVKLGGHFVRQHRGALLHDNQDGTLTERGKDANPINKPAVVISRGPPDQNEPPMLPPSYPNRDNTVKSNEEIKVVKQQLETSKIQPREVWDFLQPYLTKHKGLDIPESGYVQSLLGLPRLRDFDWNECRLVDHPYLDSKPRDISPLIIQVTGDLAPEPCARCASGRGLFKSCVMVSSEAPIEPLKNIVSCANCFYHCGQTYCSLKEWGAARANRIIAASKRATGPVTTEPPPSCVGPDSSVAQMTEVLEEVNEHPEEGQKVGSVGYKVILEMAEPGRPYNMWPDENGNLSPLPGVLLPTGYQLDKTDPVRPWLCPVTTCTKAFQKLKDFGFHFQRAHYGECLQDNSDGTFTFVKSYQSKKRGIGPGGKIRFNAPAVVISKTAQSKPAGSGTSAPHPGQAEPSPRHREPTLAADLGDDMSENAKKLWSHIRPALTNFSMLPLFTTFRSLLELPFQRPLRYRSGRSDEKIFDKESRDVAAVAIQVTGDIPDHSKVCASCQNGEGPWQDCIILSRNACAAAKAQYSSCANCLLGGNQARCSLRHWIRTREKLTTTVASTTTRTPTEDHRSSMEVDDDGDSMPDVCQEDEVTPTRAPRRSSRALTRSGLSRSHTAASRSTSISTVQQPNPRSAAVGAQQAQTFPSSLISAGTFQTEQTGILEMEEWEIAPGRIRSVEGNHNIALSNAIVANQAIPIANGVAARTCSILPGTVLNLAAERTMIRQLWVASGKVKVTLGANPEFTIGPHGCVIIRPGVSCTVRNTIYVDAWLHVTEMMSYLWGASGP